MPNVGSLVLLRHGESTLNAQGRLTGLLDPGLTDRGRNEATHAAELLRAASFEPDSVYCSTMLRARETAKLITQSLTAGTFETHMVWQLNERNYGYLTGRGRNELLAEFGPVLLHEWRRSFHGAPPPMSARQLASISRNPAVAAMPQGTALRTESLETVVYRVRSLWLSTLRPALVGGSDVLVVGHGNSLRALCMVVGSLGEETVERLNLPTGQPLFFRFNSRIEPLIPGGTYLDPGDAAEAIVALIAVGGT